MKYLFILLFTGCAAAPAYHMSETMDKKYEYIVGTDHKYFIVATWDGQKEKWVYWKKRGNLE